MRKYAALTGLLAGAVTLAVAVYVSSADPVLGYPWGVSVRFVNESDSLLTALSAVGMLAGMGLVMIVGGLVAFRSPTWGGLLVVGAAVVGLVYTYTHEWHRVDLLYVWAAPVLLCWLAGILAGYALHEETEAHG